MRTAVSDAMPAESQTAAPRCTDKKTCNNLDLLPHATESELVHVAHIAVGHVEGPQVRYPSAGLTGFVQRRPMHLKRSAAMVRKAYQPTVRCAQVTFEVART